MQVDTAHPLIHIRVPRPAFIHFPPIAGANPGQTLWCGLIKNEMENAMRSKKTAQLCKARRYLGVASIVLSFFSAGSLTASTIPLFSTGSPDGKIATLSRTPGAGLETETADDFILGQAAYVTYATFVGLLPTGGPLSSVSNIEIELYHVFPRDSVNHELGEFSFGEQQIGNKDL